jgi:hypothetical protein
MNKRKLTYDDIGKIIIRDVTYETLHVIYNELYPIKHHKKPHVALRKEAIKILSPFVLTKISFRRHYKKQCKYCEKINSQFRCSLCKGVFYCSNECSEKDWINHKNECETHYPVEDDCTIETHINYLKVYESQEIIDQKGYNYYVLEERDHVYDWSELFNKYKNYIYIKGTSHLQRNDEYEKFLVKVLVTHVKEFILYDDSNEKPYFKKCTECFKVFFASRIICSSIITRSMIEEKKMCNNWYKQRLLWIANIKCQESPFSLLPKEMIKQIWNQYLYLINYKHVMIGERIK